MVCWQFFILRVAAVLRLLVRNMLTRRLENMGPSRVDGLLCAECCIVILGQSGVTIRSLKLFSRH